MPPPPHHQARVACREKSTDGIKVDITLQYVLDVQTKYEFDTNTI
jgi:hypothetical protein